MSSQGGSVQIGRLPSRQIEKLTLPIINGQTNTHDWFYSISQVDHSGRITVRSAVKVLEWPAECTICFKVVQRLVVVLIKADRSRFSIKHGHVRLPASTRLSCRIGQHSSVLLAASKEKQQIIAIPVSALDNLLLHYFRLLEAD